MSHKHLIAETKTWYLLAKAQTLRAFPFPLTERSMSCVPSSHSIILNPWATAIAKVHDGHWAERRGKFLLLYASQTRGVVCYCSNQLWPISPMVFKLSFCSPEYSTLFCKDTVAYWFDGEILCVKGSNFRLLYCPKSTYTSLFILLQQLVSRTRKKVTFLNNRFLTVLFLSLFIKMQISPNLISELLNLNYRRNETVQKISILNKSSIYS